MKNLTITLLLAVLSIHSYSQENIKRKEVGLTFASFNSFGLTYKTGTNKALWRFNTLFASGNNRKEESDSSNYEYSSSVVGVKLGKEFRRPVANKLELRFGADVSFSYGLQKNLRGRKTNPDNDSKYKRETFEPGINLLFGLNYLIGDQLALGAEILPHFTYMMGTSKHTESYWQNGSRIFYEEKEDISGVSYGLSNSSVLLSVSYRF